MTSFTAFKRRDPADEAPDGLTTRRLGLAMAIYALMVLICTAVLGVAVGFPGIVDKPAGAALRLFYEHRTVAVVFFYLFAGAGLLFSVIAIAAPRLLGAGKSTFTAVFTAAGVAAGLLRCIGFLRFSLIAPQLSQQYVNNDSPAAKEAARTGWLIVNAVVGEIVGDLLAFGLSAVFIAGIAYTLGRTGRFSRWWTLMGQILSVYGLLELATFVLPKPLTGVAGFLFPLSYAASILWLGATGLRLYYHRSAPAGIQSTDG